MKKELQKPVMQAIVALILVVMVRIAAMVTLKSADAAYSLIDVMLSIAVAVVLLSLVKEFNRQLVISYPELPQARSLASWLVILLVVLTIYGAFRRFSNYLPSDLYFIIFFILSLIPIYFLWNIIYKNADTLPGLLVNIFIEEKLACSCGWKNPVSAKFCSRCGSPVRRGEQ